MKESELPDNMNCTMMQKANSQKCEDAKPWALQEMNNCAKSYPLQRTIPTSVPPVGCQVAVLDVG